MTTGIRIVLAGVAGAAAWWVGLQLFFGAAQSILADPDLQSPKLMAIFETPPPPRMATDPWLLPAGMLVVALFQAAVFAFIRGSLPRGLILRGLAFGAIAWALFVPWFEFYLPWGVMLEPTLLVLLECLCWAGLMALVGVAISFAFGREPASATASATG